MAGWEVWRQDDNGQRCPVAVYSDRVHALACVLVYQSGPGFEPRYPGKQRYEVTGPPTHAVVTNRDLYLRLLALGEHLSQTGRALLDYLCALWAVSQPLAVDEELDGDLFAAMLTAAAAAEPARPCSSWSVADFTVDGPYIGYHDFAKVIGTQVVDLLAFQDSPPGPYAALGVEAPPRIDGGRATIPLWCNFDAATFLECAAAGSFGGWSLSDGRRVSDSGDGHVTDDVMALPPITWGDVGAFLEYGQSFE
jgi:hypothetical protein